ncbi:hypothetical protein [Feifania hominis]|uniref:Uncharacterized protein n=1 Tax=Feifania hominis TaxID=2763660 RepID=A0A926DFH1_9FIRM|nr:hypothetical protein [Feifania hominis]MBC8536891.1 hypothetical protein [Feifania hominis]
MDLLLDSALQAGLPVSEFWQASPGEIGAAVRAREEQRMDSLRLLAWLFYSCAALTAVGVHDPKRFPGIQKAFPTLFEEEPAQDWRLMKQRVEDYGALYRERHPPADHPSQGGV